MWDCPKCAESVDDDFDICWQCGTDRHGNEDQEFTRAEDTEAIFDPAEDQDLKPLPDLDDEFGEGLSDVVICHSALDIIEARFVADQLRRIGIPAISDKQNHIYGPGVASFGSIWGNGPKVRVRPQDLTRALTWVEGFKAKRQERRDRPDEDNDDE